MSGWQTTLGGSAAKTERPTGPINTRANPGDYERYALGAFDKEIGAVRSAPEGERNQTLNRAAFCLGQLVGAGMLSESTVVQALTAAALQAGLGRTETGKTIASGVESGKKEPRQMPEPKSRVNATGGSPANDDYEHTDADAPNAPNREKEPPEQPTQADPLRGLKHLSAVAVLGKDAILTLAREPVEYAWDDIAVMATVVLIAGPPSGGKTTLLFLLLAARLSATPVNLLGRNVQPSDPKQYIVLIEGEHSEPSAARKLVRSIELLDGSLDALERVIIVARKAVRLGSPEWVDVERMVQQGLVSDIAIDTVARVAPADGSSEQEQVAIFDAVARTIEFGPEDRKPLVWAVAHIRKNGQTGDVEDVSGSTQRTGQADSVLLIKPEKEGGRTVSTTVTFVKLREDPEDRWPEPAQFSIVTEAGRRVLKQDSATETADPRPLEDRIVEKLATGAKTKGALKSALKRSDKDIDEALTNLFTARSIRTTWLTVRGIERKAFELSAEWRQGT